MRYLKCGSLIDILTRPFKAGSLFNFNANLVKSLSKPEAYGIMNNYA